MSTRGRLLGMVMGFARAESSGPSGCRRMDMYFRALSKLEPPGFSLLGDTGRTLPSVLSMRGPPTGVLLWMLLASEGGGGRCCGGRCCGGGAERLGPAGGPGTNCPGGGAGDA